MSLIQVVLVIAAAVYVGVVLPAVWSKSQERRTAAIRVLDRLLRVLKRRF